ncbi:MAG: hypothetical protein ACD_22C00041G0005 [uncultured bacterium]|nr:MAG: hypothetical protein ACD_22C00041G0005 [uncultured bacterium]
MKIYINYKYTNEPWGGANSFIRTLSLGLSNFSDVVLVDSLDRGVDILLMNQLHSGPLGDTNLNTFNKVKKFLIDSKDSAGGKVCKLVVRAVNLKVHSGIHSKNPKNILRSLWQDIQVIMLANIADYVIFQSEYQRNIFKKFGYNGYKNRIIFNGASSEYSHVPASSRVIGDRLTLVSVTASPRSQKRHDLIARVSLDPRVDVLHFGRWPDKVKPLNVKLMGVQGRDAMIKAFKDAHYLIFPAEKEPCSNAVCEALSCGLPVIYNPAPGGCSELVLGNGFGLNVADIKESIDKAFSDYAGYVAKLKEKRDFYTSERAVSDYYNVFKEVCCEN